MNLEMLIKPFSKKSLLIQNKMPCHLLRVNIFPSKKKGFNTEFRIIKKFKPYKWMLWSSAVNCYRQDKCQIKAWQNILIDVPVSGCHLWSFIGLFHPHGQCKFLLVIIIFNFLRVFSLIIHTHTNSCITLAGWTRENQWFSKSWVRSWSVSATSSHQAGEHWKMPRENRIK